MVLTSDKILSNSFVVTIDEQRYAAFEKSFKSAGLYTIPQKIVGYQIEERYLLKKFKLLSELHESPQAEQQEKYQLNIRLIRSLCNNASHFAIVQHALLLDLPFVTIFEDDATPIDNCIEKLNLYCSDIPDEIDVLRLGYCLDPEMKPLKSLPSQIPHSEYLIEKNFCGSHAYIVFNKYYKQFLEDNKIQPRCDFRKINPTGDKVVFELKEPLFVQNNVLNAPVIHDYRSNNEKVAM